jgi:hypothetical protein
VAEITVQVAAIFVAEMVVASRHAHDFAAFGKAQALGRPFVCFHLWHFSLLIFVLFENKQPYTGKMFVLKQLQSW